MRNESQAAAAQFPNVAEKAETGINSKACQVNQVKEPKDGDLTFTNMILISIWKIKGKQSLWFNSFT